MSIIGISMALSSIPQAIEIYQSKSSKNISIWTWAVLTHGIFWWLVYGIKINSLSLIVTNSICLILYSIVLFLVVRYRRG